MKHENAQTFRPKFRPIFRPILRPEFRPVIKICRHNFALGNVRRNALFCRLAFALFRAHLRSLTCFCVRPRLERPHLGAATFLQKDAGFQVARCEKLQGLAGWLQGSRIKNVRSFEMGLAGGGWRPAAPKIQQPFSPRTVFSYS